MKSINSAVIVKFFKNTNPNNKNKLVTRTLMKIGIIDENYEGANQPQAGEFWKCKIVKETAEGKPSGCFLLHPMEKIEVKDIYKLIPGMYNESRENGIMFVTPKDNYKNMNCILALSHRKNIKNIYAVIVSLEDLSEVK